MITHQARSLILQPPSTKAPAAPWIAVAGGKGGVGKTLLAVNMAILAARSGHRTLLVDLDPGLANVDVHLRLPARFSVEDVADELCTPQQALKAGPHGLACLLGRSGSTRLASGERGRIAAALTAVARAAAGFDVVVCDTGAGIGPAVVEVARRASLVLAVTTPDPSAVTDAYALCKVLVQERCTAPRVVVNQVHSREEAMRTGARLRSVARKFLDVDLPLLGWLRADPLLERSVREQRPFAASGAAPVIEDLRAITAAALSGLAGLRRSVPNAASATAAQSHPRPVTK